MIGSWLRPAAWLAFAWWFAASATAQGPEEGSLAGRLGKEIEPSQVTVDRALVDGRATFRATVLQASADRMILLTAAHCLSGARAGDAFAISQGDHTWGGKVAALTFNPAFRPSEAAGPGPGPDVAIVGLVEDPGRPGWAEAIRRVRPAEFTSTPGARPVGEAISAMVVDQDRALHVVRAGNFRNPRWIEWGKKYEPRRGDSGSGIFVARRDASGRARPVLIGAVSVVDLEGGGGVLIWSREPWVARALAERP